MTLTAVAASPQAPPTEDELEKFKWELKDLDRKTFSELRRLVLTKLGREDQTEDILLVAHIPRELAGREMVFAGRAPDAEGELMSFQVKPMSTEAESMLVALAGPAAPVAISYAQGSDLNNVAVYRVDERGGGSITTVPASADSAREFFRTAPDTEGGFADEVQREMRDDIATTRRDIFEAGRSTTKVASDLRITGEAVRQRLRRKEILGIKLNGDYRFPAWQFNPQSESGVLDGVRDVLRVTNLNALELAIWFETPQAELDGEKPANALWSGRKDVVVAAAAAVGAV